MTKLENKDIKFDKNRIARLEEINKLIRIVDESLKENVGGFLTHYTQKIKALSTIPSVTAILEDIKMSEEEKVKRMIKDKEQKRFWDSFDFYMKNNIEFRKRAMNIIGKLFVENKFVKGKLDEVKE